MFLLYSNSSQPSLTQISCLKAHCGVKGIVKDQITDKVIRDAMVRVEDTKPVTVSDRGEFWKLVLPGTYTMVSSDY